MASTLRGLGVYDPSSIFIASELLSHLGLKMWLFPSISELWWGWKNIRTGINGNELISLFHRQWIISSLLVIYVNLNMRQTENYCVLHSLPQKCCHIWKHIIIHMSSFKLSLNLYSQWQFVFVHNSLNWFSTRSQYNVTQIKKI